MSREPGEGPDEDGESDDQPAEPSPEPNSQPEDSAEGVAEADSEPRIHRLEGGQDETVEEADTERADGDDGSAEVTGSVDVTEPAEGDDGEEVDGGDEEPEGSNRGKEESDDDGEGKGESDEEVASADDGSEETGPAITPIERKTGPPEDQEQPLTEHIEEMVKRVAVVLVIAGLVSLLAFPYGEEFINFLWYSVLPSDISKPHVYHPLELIVTQLQAASLLGVVLALPVLVYETYAFMRPGLYPHERRYYLAAVPTSLVLAFVGLLFGYFLVLPVVMSYFMQYSRNVVDIAFALGDTFTLMLVLLGFLAVVFQIPLFIMLAIMMGLTTRTWLEEKRLIMWGVFAGIAFLFSPDPTGMAPFLIALTMIGLYEGTLLLLRWTGRGAR
ncbi:MAG: twin-arginine translocase subunit TatC [Halodesulfurarchaeum sp.]